MDSLTTASMLYVAHDELTDPGEHAPRLDELPDGVPGLHLALNGLLLHAWKARAWYRHLLTPPPRKVTIRHTSRLLAEVLRLDDAPLHVARPVERRVVVDCRHFAVLLCAVLRHRGVPARPRCGFASYLQEGEALEDHWACEYRRDADGRWVMEDPDLQRHDVPADAFVTGARAWRLAREDPALAARYEYGAGLRGWAALRLNVVRDVAAVNGFPSVSGDGWGLGLAPEESLTAADRRALDRAAELCGAGADLAEQRALYATVPGLAPPDAILHFERSPEDARPVRWRVEP